MTAAKPAAAPDTGKALGRGSGREDMTTTIQQSNIRAALQMMFHTTSAHAQESRKADEAICFFGFVCLFVVVLPETTEKNKTLYSQQSGLVIPCS